MKLQEMFLPKGRYTLKILLFLIALIKGINIFKYFVQQGENEFLIQERTSALYLEVSLIIFFVLFCTLAILTIRERKRFYANVLQAYLFIRILLTMVAIIINPTIEPPYVADIAWVLLYGYTIICIQFWKQAKAVNIL